MSSASLQDSPWHFASTQLNRFERSIANHFGYFFLQSPVFFLYWPHLGKQSYPFFLTALFDAMAQPAMNEAVHCCFVKPFHSLVSKISKSFIAMTWYPLVQFHLVKDEQPRCKIDGEEWPCRFRKPSYIEPFSLSVFWKIFTNWKS